jgi:hypothetical protein
VAKIDGLFWPGSTDLVRCVDRCAGNNRAAHSSTKRSRPPKKLAMKPPSVFVTALCVGLFYVGLFAELAHASKTDPYVNYALKTDPHLAHVAKAFARQAQ